MLEAIINKEGKKPPFHHTKGNFGDQQKQTHTPVIGEIRGEK